VAVISAIISAVLKLENVLLKVYDSQRKPAYTAKQEYFSGGVLPAASIRDILEKYNTAPLSAAGGSAWHYRKIPVEKSALPPLSHIFLQSLNGAPDGLYLLK
jgi:hypothetical protein